MSQKSSPSAALGMRVQGSRIMALVVTSTTMGSLMVVRLLGGSVGSSSRLRSTGVV
jgi:hypothetical protein